MSWLAKLQKDRESRIDYENEENSLREMILEINDLHKIHDGKLIRELREFINNFKLDNV